MVIHQNAVDNSWVSLEWFMWISMHSDSSECCCRSCSIGLLIYVYSDSSQCWKDYGVAAISVHINIFRVIFTLGSDSADSGVVTSPLLLLSGYVNGRPRSLRHSFRLRQPFKVSLSSMVVKSFMSCLRWVVVENIRTMKLHQSKIAIDRSILQLDSLMQNCHWRIHFTTRFIDAKFPLADPLYNSIQIQWNILGLNP